MGLCLQYGWGACCKKVYERSVKNIVTHSGSRNEPIECSSMAQYTCTVLLQMSIHCCPHHRRAVHRGATQDLCQRSGQLVTALPRRQQKCITYWSFSIYTDGVSYFLQGISTAMNKQRQFLFKKNA